MREYFDLFMNDADTFIGTIIGMFALVFIASLFISLAVFITNSGKDDDY